MRRPLLTLAGAALLTGFSIAALPFSRGFLHVPRTPFGDVGTDFTVPAWVLLARADPLIPRGATVLPRSEPPDPTTDTYLHRFAVGLLPGRRIVAAARWFVPSSPEEMSAAEYEVVVGEKPQIPPGRLLLETPEGSIWRRGR
ncbi:MAG TPA: hypothetical protein VK392_10570 [Thermoanaerobaculia bacterium]|nr:hypothetical protein [Thermoanaerobaculia bacterium]